MASPDLAAPGLINIAVLDDDADFRTYIEDFLRDEGAYSVRAYAHPEDLFVEAEQRVPDIVLLDMKMGEFKGEKVLEQLLTRWPNLCVIVVTGYPSLEDMRVTFKLQGLRLSVKAVFTESTPADSAECHRSVSAWAVRIRTGFASGLGIGSSYCASSATGR